ncbi:MAG: cytochrome c-type biogenesis protein CcmH [Gammaproteobacteria bacterium]|nr:cytochrome c-type biogenesis protein CcmH [Gammaproteobacteria bacterium]NND60610.1 cytochrome c-type biogenesis protein CcmH [Gammaproteobacteria bacterium]
MRVLLAALMLLPLAVVAIDQDPPMADPQLQARYEKLSNELRCLVCQNQSIADSTAPLADDLRQQVREMLIAGRSDNEILDYMVERYGDFVRYRPAFNDRTWLLWVGPFAVIAIALVIGVRVVRRGMGEVESD